MKSAKRKTTIKLKSIKNPNLPPKLQKINPSLPSPSKLSIPSPQKLFGELNTKKPSLLKRLPSLSPSKHNLKSSNKKSMTRTKRNLSLENIFQGPKATLSLKRNESLPDIQNNIKEWNISEIPYTVKDVLKYFNFALTSFEKVEIREFENIYYLGMGVVKLITNLKVKNFGFDDERNDLILIRSDHLLYRFEIFEIIGCGSYGQVVKVFDHKEQKILAAKILRSMSCITNQAKIELQILDKLGESGNRSVIKILENFVFRGHIIETFELLDMNFYEIIQFKGVIIDIKSIKLYARQILEGMEHYSELSVIHCDLKPENIMLDQPKNQAVIIDFGSACFENNKLYTYIQSRCYRAPEVIFEIGYDIKIDIWSFGCILAELLLGFPLFTGKNESLLLASIIEVLDFPPPSLFKKSKKSLSLLPKLKRALSNHKSLNLPGSRPLYSLFNEYPLFLSFLSRSS